MSTDYSYLEKGPWRGDKWWVSHYDYADDVLEQLEFPDEISFHDVTLRDGEQTPGIVFRREDKIRIAEALDDVGVHRIEAGMPVVSEEEFQAVRDIAHLGLNAGVFAFARLRKEDIDAALKADVYGVITEGPTGYPKLIKQFQWEESQVVDDALEAVEYAKGHGLYTLFFAVDSTRADFGFLSGLLKKLEKETEVDGFVLADTFGSLSPEGAKYFIKSLRREVTKPLEIHGHNDFGMATAVSIAALSAGAKVVHVSVNGIGERAGNASFEEVALALKLLYGMDLPFKFEKFYQLSKLVQELSRVPLAPNKPVVGERVFTREAGISIAGWVKYNLGSEAYLPELVGNKHGVVLGKKSGRHTIEWKLEQMNIKATEDQVARILDLVKKRSEEKKGSLTEEEFRHIVGTVLEA